MRGRQASHRPRRRHRGVSIVDAQLVCIFHAIAKTLPRSRHPCLFRTDRWRPRLADGPRSRERGQGRRLIGDQLQLIGHQMMLVHATCHGASNRRVAAISPGELLLGGLWVKIEQEGAQADVAKPDPKEARDERGRSDIGTHDYQLCRGS